jgi:RNA polymerase sigma factor (sigma-70 family)
VLSRTKLSVSPINDLAKIDLQTACDERLLSAARRGNQAAFGELCSRHAKKILHVTLRITRNYEDAEDALQECFLNAFVHLKEFDGRSQFSTWLTRIAMNAALMKLRRTRLSRETSFETTDDFGKELPHLQIRDHAANPEDRYAEHEKNNLLRQALGTLRPRLRAAVEIRQMQECSMKETAKMLGISEAATKGRLFQARAVLRKSTRVRNLVQSRVRPAA